MIDSAQAYASSQDALTKQYQAITQNLANASTVGYKRIVCEVEAAGASPAGSVAAATSVSAKLSLDLTQGHLVQTGRALDLALNGPGFFVLETPQGNLYTRHGMFQVNAQGQVVDAAGRTVAGESGPLVLPRGGSESLNVGADGRIFAGKQEVGKLRLVEFEKTQTLEPTGQCAYRARSGAAPAAAAKTTVQQGYQEASNVNVVDELVGLITVSRLYEANAKSIRSQDERYKNLIQVAMG
jgi:flagellar basal body rod protein FlgG